MLQKCLDWWWVCPLVERCDPDMCSDTDNLSTNRVELMDQSHIKAITILLSLTLRRRLIRDWLISTLQMHTHYSSLRFCQCICDRCPSINCVPFVYAVRFSLSRRALCTTVQNVELTGWTTVHIWETLSVYSDVTWRQLDCLFKSLLMLQTKKHQGSALLTLCDGNSAVDSPHKGPVTRKAFLCVTTYAIMLITILCLHN